MARSPRQANLLSKASKLVIFPFLIIKSNRAAAEQERRRMSADAKWSELPGDLLGLIIDKLKTNTFYLLEYIRFGAVCSDWRSFFIQNDYKQIKLPSNLPVLLLPSEFDDPANTDYLPPYISSGPPNTLHYYYKRNMIWKDQDQMRHKSTRSFYSLSKDEVNQDFRLPVPYYKNCRGSSHGWLITVDEEEQPDGTYIYPVRLLNPFRSTVSNQIQLPPLTPIPELEEEPKSSYYLCKAYLSANPSSLSNPSKEDLLVLGVYGSNRFGFCRPGDSAWTHFPLDDQFRPIEDLICYKGRFLAVIQNGSVLELDFAHHALNVKFFVAPRPPNGNIFYKKYLVESGGDLLQVERHVDDDYSTTGFRAFKLKDDDDDAHDDDDNLLFEIDDFAGADDKQVKMDRSMNGDGKYWVEMKDNLDGRSLFLGDNSSISLSAAADHLPGLMPNCIYFTDDNYVGYEVDPWVGPHDIGVFNFEDRSIVFRHRDNMPPPIWIQPML